MTKIRGFELVSTYNNQELLPKRETAHAAGYDLKVAENTVIAPGEIVLEDAAVYHRNRWKCCRRKKYHRSFITDLIRPPFQTSNGPIDHH